MSSSATPEAALCLDDIRAAAGRLRGQAVRTPLLESPLLNAEVGRRVLVKAECLQRTGSFKFRGAFNKLSGLSPAAQARGVVAFSSGNHAQGVAVAAQILEIPATIVMPADAPRLKIENTRAYGAKVVTYDRVREDRREIAEAIARDQGAALVPPYDDPAIMAGQGTVGLELSEQLNEIGAQADAVLIPCSGGGLTAGTATALHDLAPDMKVYTVEPTGFDDTARSLAAGERLRNSGDEQGLCDALLVSPPGELTFAINQRLVAGGLVVEDCDVRRAMALAFSRLKVVLEPSGAAALAAILSGAYTTGVSGVVVVGSGGNVDTGTFRDALIKTSN